MKLLRKLRSKKSRVSKTEAWLAKYHWLVWAALLVVAAVIFGLRNTAAFTMPNFYAEDATVVYRGIYEQNPLSAVLTPFNGYLVVGQYIPAYLAAGVNLLFGNDIADLALVSAVVSCLFLGFVASLPYLLFRRRLGTPLAILLVLLTALIPMVGYDYAIIGTLGQVKFAFLYIAFLLIVYRATTPHIGRKRLLLIDTGLFLCVLTNVTVAVLLPLALLPYLKSWFSSLRAKRLPKFTFPQVSGLALTAISFLYIVAVLVRGIPETPGYLDSPFKPEAILPIIDRSTFYALSYPFTESMNGSAVALLTVIALATVAWVAWHKHQTGFVLLAAIWTVAAGTGLFVMNRPGVGEFFLNFNHRGGPDQFFYAQNMVFLFAVAWFVKDKLQTFQRTRWAALLAGLAVYLLIAVPLGASFGKSVAVHKDVETIDYYVTKACRENHSQDVIPIQVYPTVEWQWRVDRKLVCE